MSAPAPCLTRRCRGFAAGVRPVTPAWLVGLCEGCRFVARRRSVRNPVVEAIVRRMVRHGRVAGRVQ